MGKMAAEPKCDNHSLQEDAGNKRPCVGIVQHQIAALSNVESYFQPCGTGSAQDS